MVGDPIGDMIIRIKNASKADIDSITIPFSKLNFEIANVLKDAGYLKSVDIVGKDKVQSKKLEIGIAYYEKAALTTGRRKPKVQDVERISKLSRRVYSSLSDILATRKTRGITILSSTKGIITNKGAKEHKVGGELLFRIW